MFHQTHVIRSATIELPDALRPADSLPAALLDFGRLWVAVRNNKTLIAAAVLLSLSAVTGFMLVATPIIMLRTGSNWRDLGVAPRQAGKDVLIGVAAFCMLAPIVYAIQAVLVQFQKYLADLDHLLSPTDAELSNGRVLTAGDLRVLVNIHRYMEDRFGRHLNLLRSRSGRH